MLINFNILTPEEPTKTLMTRIWCLLYDTGLVRNVCFPVNSFRGVSTKLHQGIKLNSRCFSKVSNFSRVPLLPHWTVLRPHVTPLLVSGLSSQAARTASWRKGNRATLTYVVALAVAVVGMSYAAVPLYRLFCQASGYGGTVKKGHGGKVEHMQPVTDRLLTIKFNADTSATMQWQFKPQQREIKVCRFILPLTRVCRCGGERKRCISVPATNNQLT